MSSQPWLTPNERPHIRPYHAAPAQCTCCSIGLPRCQPTHQVVQISTAPITRYAEVLPFDPFQSFRKLHQSIGSHLFSPSQGPVWLGPEPIGLARPYHTGPAAYYSHYFALPKSAPPSPPSLGLFTSAQFAYMASHQSGTVQSAFLQAFSRNS